MSFMGRGTHIPSDVCSPTPGTHISNDICSPTPKLHILPRNTYYISLVICIPLPRKHVSPVGEHISLGITRDLPVDIRSIDEVNKFKSKLKTFLFKRVYELS